MENKKYYYLKFKENFFDDEAMIILQGMQDGYIYSDILLKMYLRSLKYDGKLVLNGYIPYSPKMLADVLHHQVGTVEKAVGIFRDLGLIEVLDDGTIYMLNIQNYIGSSSTEADRIREYRKSISNYKCLSSEVENAIKEIEHKETSDLEKALKDFEVMRNKIKKPLTSRAKQMVINKLDKLANDDNTKIAILNQSIMHCWQDVYELKDNNSKSVDILPTYDKSSNSEMSKQEADELLKLMGKK